MDNKCELVFFLIKMIEEEDTFNAIRTGCQWYVESASRGLSYTLEI